MKAPMVLFVTIATWAILAIGSFAASWMLLGVLGCLVLRCFALRRQQGLISRDPLLLAVLLPAAALVLYDAMFSVIEVKSYLESENTEQYSALWIGCNFLYAMLAGGAWHLAMPRRTPTATSSAPQRAATLGTLLLVAWAPLLVAALCYLAFFAGKEYVEIHSNPSVVANLLLKTIYFSYAATFRIASLDSIAASTRKKHVLLLLLGHIVVFAFLYKLRSPAIFFALLTLFLIGRSLPKYAIWGGALVAPWALALIALARDPTLLNAGPALAILTLVVTFGDFVDALRFSADYIATTGPLWGAGMLGSFLGITEPLANIYAKSISEDYFDEGGGFGFFILADIHANYGVFVGAIFSAVFGFGLSRLATARFGTATSFLSCIFFASAIALTRNDFGSTLRGIVYSLLAYAVLQLAMRPRTANTP